MRVLYGCLVFLLSFGCKEPSISAGNQNRELDKTVDLDSTFELKVGETVAIRDEQCTFTFDSVRYDNRCPEGARCRSAGDAEVVVQFADARDTMHTYIEPHEIMYNVYTIRLMQLVPNTIVGHLHSQDEYIATLVVTKNQE